MAKVQRSAGFKRHHSLVPGSWELIRRDISGEFEVLAQNVASYDILPDGTVAVTNGFRVNSINASEKKTVFRHPIIEVLKSAKS